ncbi:Centrosomal protein of 76 kDa [Kappamyces sp. JEL0829]|nr:Centrosomal protein of 76 kDa [Kappamyces sp. JEL0829]
MIDKLTEKVKAESKASIVPKPSLDAFINRPGPKSLRLTFVKGRALVGLRNMEPESNSALQVHVQFQTARFATKRVLSSIEPIFNETVEFDLPSKDVNLLVDLDCPIQIVLTESNVNGETQAVGVAQIEWRKVLHSGRISTLVELTDQLHPQITVGTLDIVLDFLPSDGERARRDEIEYHIKKQEQKKADVHTAFYLLAKQWWSDFLQIRPSHSTRLVKIFTNDEFGRRMPVSHFVGPLYCPWLETPRHAARFVSLIEYAPSKRIGESSLMEVWQSAHSFLAVGKGDVQDHCLLLCSLLLGFHLDAYVTLGTDSSNEPHMWITTIDFRGGSRLGSLPGQAKFWEPLTGIQCFPQDKHQYRSIGCCFNDRHVYANIQVVDGADRIKFKMSDPASWKVLDTAPTVTRTMPSFLPPSIKDPQTTGLEVEQVLRQLIEYYRKDHHQTCIWDDALSNLLGQSLWSMEYGKISGQSTVLFSEDFQMGIKKSIPDGHTFKGFPMSFNHTHPQRIMQALVRSKQSRDIMLMRGDMVRMAVRVKVFVYCENVICCWLSSDKVAANAAAVASRDLPCVRKASNILDRPTPIKDRTMPDHDIRTSPIPDVSLVKCDSVPYLPRSNPEPETASDVLQRIKASHDKLQEIYSAKANGDSN